MTIEELNKIIQEELKAYLNEEQTDEAYMEDGDDDIEVTTDEPAAETGEEALDLLRQIYDLIKPQVEDELEDEDESEEEPEAEDEEPADEEPADEEGDEEEAVDESFPSSPGYKADDVQNVTYENDEYLNESVARFKKLANIKG